VSRHLRALVHGALTWAAGSRYAAVLALLVGIFVYFSLSLPAFLTSSNLENVLASAEAVKRHKLEVLGELLGHEWAGVDPAQMGLGPVHAVAKLLTRHQHKMDDLKQMELNEAFAAQVLACQAAWDSAEYARAELKLEKPLGRMDPARLNPEGGAVACGHPVGSSGARLVLHLLHALKRKGGGSGVATLCIGGGQGGAMLVRV